MEIAIAVVLAIVIALGALTQMAPQAMTRWALALERGRSGLTLKAQDIAGFTMPYLEGGHGEVLVLVHGFGGDKDNFTRIARHLTPHFHVIIPDLPGFGDASRDPSVRYCMADQVQRLHLFLKALGITRLQLGGNSMGGFIAVQYAAAYPLAVASLWLLDAAGTEAANQTPMMANYEATGELPLLLRSLSDGDALINATMSRPPFFPGFIKKVLAQRGVADYALHSKIMQDLKHHSPPLETQFSTLDTPALIVWGSEDKVLNPQAAQTLQKLLPNHQSILMQGIGHLPMLEAPKLTAQDYLAFLKNWSQRQQGTR